LGEAKRSDIKNFLIEFKKIVVTGRGLDIVPRRENLNALSDIGLTNKNLKEETLALSVQDYCEGPDLDRDRPGEIWIFGRQVAGKEIYIKLKIAQVGREKIAKCLSFHAANFPLCFPYRDKKGGK
jgi:hypothetical protein